MLRGVSKQIIEINDTGNKYFDRAVLYVNHEYIGDNEQMLTDEAQRIVTAMGKPPATAEKQRKKLVWLKAALFASYPILAIIVFLLAKTV